MRKDDSRLFSIEEEERIELGEAGSIHVLKYAFCLACPILVTKKAFFDFYHLLEFLGKSYYL